jgi:hypothetical protein
VGGSAEAAPALVPAWAWAVAGRLRIDSRATASTNARASTPRPASCAPMTGAPSGSAAVFATVRPLAFPVPDLPGGSADGVSEGNRPEALPPGLSSGLALTTPGRLPTDSGDVSTPGMVVPGAVGSAELEEVAAGAVTVVADDTCGSLDTCAAFSAAVRRTDVTVVAEAATATFACSCRWAELASSAPRSHDAVPSWLPQPKLNVGFRLAGVAVRRMVASGTLPPVVQAVTVHRADCPRWMLDCAGWTETQRLTCVAGVVAAARATELPPVVVVAEGLGVRVAVGVEDALAFWEAADVVFVGAGVGVLVAVLLAVLVGVAADVAAVDFADALALVVDVVDVAGFADGVDVFVGDVVVCGLLADGELLDDFRVWVVVLVDDLAVVPLADVLDVGVLVGELLVGGSLAVGSLVVGVGLGEGLVELGVGVGLGDAEAACTGSHCCTVPLLAVATARIRPAG